MRKIYHPVENYTRHIFQQLTGNQTNTLQYTILYSGNVETSKHLIQIKFIWIYNRLTHNKGKHTELKFIHCVTVCLM